MFNQTRAASPRRASLSALRSFCLLYAHMREGKKNPAADSTRRGSRKGAGNDRRRVSLPSAGLASGGGIFFATANVHRIFEPFFAYA